MLIFKYDSNTAENKEVEGGDSNILELKRSTFLVVRINNRFLM